MPKKAKKSTKRKFVSPKKKGPYRVQAIAKGAGYRLAPSKEILERADDLEEVRSMLEMGEIDIAVDELRWLLMNCHELLEAHAMLGHIAFGEEDWDLARAHLGRAYELGIDAVGKSLGGPLPHNDPANKPFFDAGQLLADCLGQLGEKEEAGKVMARLRKLDPALPLQLL